MDKIQSIGRAKILLCFCLLASLAATDCSLLLPEEPEPLLPLGEKSSSTEFYAPSKEVGITELDAPAGFRISDREYGDKINLIWDEVKNADYYIVTRAELIDGVESGMSETAKVLGQLTYVDKIPVDTLNNDEIAQFFGKSWKYTVQAARYDGLTGTPSEERVGALLLPPAAGLSGSKDSDELVLKWTHDPVINANVAYYNVYRSRNPDSLGELLSRKVYPSRTVYKDVSDSVEYLTDYFYTIKSVSNTGEESKIPLDVHPRILGIRIPPGSLRAPSNLMASKGDSVAASPQITLTWDAVAPVDDGKITYNVYRFDSSSTTRILLHRGETDDAAFTESSGVVTYKDTDTLDDFMEYYYQIQGVEVVGVERKEGAYSPDPVGTEDPATGYLLSPPTRIEARSDGTSITVTWNPSLMATGYRLFVSADNSAFTENSVIAGGNTSGTTITDDGSRFFKMTAVNANFTIETGQSEAVEILPPPPENVTASKNGNVSGSENSKGVFPIKITWDSTPGAVSYSVYRALEEDGRYVLIGDLNTTDYIDTQSFFLPGSVYYYKVRAKNGSDGSGDFSDGDYGYGALTPDIFYLEYFKTINTSHSKMTYMHKGGLNALGEETVHGAQGSVLYKATGGLSGGDVRFTYSNYAEYKDPFDNWYFVLNGYYTINASISGDGSMGSTITAAGMYPGTVNYSNIIIANSDAGGGHYTITQASGKNGNVSWSID